MNREKRAILILASRLLSYPSSDFEELKNDFDSIIEDIFDSGELAKELHHSFNPIFSMNLKELQELYVETFDLKTNLGLYLTAQELGDSNKRGAALIKIQKIISQAGFERQGDELVDYIPMLLEFLTLSKQNVETERLMKRISVALKYIYDHLPKNHPYYPIFLILFKYVFPMPSEDEIKQLESGREKADLEELPYPIMYQ